MLDFEKVSKKDEESTIGEKKDKIFKPEDENVEGQDLEETREPEEFEFEITPEPGWENPDPVDPEENKQVNLDKCSLKGKLMIGGKEVRLDDLNKIIKSN